MKVSRHPLIKSSFLLGRKRCLQFSSQIIPAYMGRYAIYRILQMLQIKEDDEVLLPAYHCLTMVVPILQYNCRLGLYRIKRGLQATVEDIRRARNSRTRAVILVHYFGLQQENIEEIRDDLHKEHIFLIEDCSHLIPFVDKRVGSYSDVSIFTPRKYLPLVDGAFIQVNRSELFNRLRNKPLPLLNEVKNFKNICEQRLIFETNHLLRESYIRADRLINQVRKVHQRPSGDGSQDANTEFNLNFINVECSRLAQYVMRTADFNWIYEKRKKVFTYLLHALCPRGQTILFELFGKNARECVFGFPVIAPQRDRITRYLKQRGIETFTFGESLYREENLDANSTEMYLSKQLLFIPSHQDLNATQLEYMVRCLKEVLLGPQ